MIQINSSTDTDNATDTDDAIAPPEVAANAEEQKTSSEEPKKRIPLVWIAATLSIGLLIAAMYLGVRIVAARKHAAPAAASIAAPGATTKPTTTPAVPQPLLPVPAVVTPAVVNPPLATPPAVTPPAVTPRAEAMHDSDDAIPTITPHAGQRYLQVGALDAGGTRRFVQRLRSQNLEPHVAPGPRPGLMRVLIGPFDNRETLNEKMAQIRSEGMDTFVRQY